MAAGDGQTRQKPSQYTMSDNQPGRGVAGADGMLGGCGERNENALLANTVTDGNRARAWNDQAPRSAPEQAPCILETGCAGHKHRFANPRLGIRAGINDAPHRLIAGNQGITHAGKGRHPPRP